MMPQYRVMTTDRAGAAMVLTATAVAAALVVALAVGTPDRSFAHHPELTSAVEAASTVVGLVAAYLVLGAHARSGSLRDLVLAGALLVVALHNLCFGAVPAAAGHVTPGSEWAALAGRALGAAALAVAALAPLDRSVRGRRSHAVTTAIALATTAVLAALALALNDSLPTARTAGAVVLQALAGVLLAAAAFGFVERWRRGGQELMAWLAAAAAVGFTSRLAFVLDGRRPSDLATAGDLLRLGFFVVLLAGALREIARYQAGLAARATLDERRRLAREMHDGFVQELAFLSMRMGRLANAHPEIGGVDDLGRAADRALGEARDVLGALTRPVDEPAARAVERAAEDVAQRAGVRVRLDADDELALGDEDLHALVRVVREATVNAVRHGDAREVAITLRGDGRARLTVHDDGRGFDTDGGTPSGPGFGLVSMRERIEARGGELRVRSGDGAGTTVEVHLP